MGEDSEQERRREKYLDELRAALSNPVHTPILGAYRGNDPLHAMEAELSTILTEVLSREDGQHNHPGLPRV